MKAEYEQYAEMISQLKREDMLAFHWGECGFGTT